MTKTKNTKRALLASGLALLLCVSMLVGSTFAWFTDSVTSAGNTIKSGTLQVDLVNAKGDSMEGQVIDFVAKDGNDNILWEPGCTYKTEPVYVVNKGNLALKYEIAINGITGDAKLLEAIEWTVTVGDTVTALADLKGDLLPEASSEAIVLSGHMKETAGNEYQNLTIEGISITVLATQFTKESDSFNDQYDALATYMNKNAAGEWEIGNLGQLLYFAQQVNSGNSYAGETIVLKNDIDLNGINWTPIGDWDNAFEGTFDGKDNTISNLTINAPSIEGVGLFGVAQNATFKGINIKNANIVGYNQAAAIVGVPYTGCTISDCHVTGDINIVAEYAYAGGIAAYGYVDIEDCSVIADGTGYITAKERNAVGGIMAWLLENGNSIKNCKVKNLNLTGWANVGSIAGFVHYNNVVDKCSAENITLTKTRVDGVQSIGALFGGWCAGNPITVSNNTVKNVTMYGTSAAYDFDLKEVYGSEYYGKTNGAFVESNNSYNYVSNIGAFANDAASLSNALAAGGDVVYTGADLDINESLTVKGNLTITDATIDADDAGEIVVDGGTLTLGEGAVICVDNEMPAGGIIRVIDNSEIILDGAEIKNCDNNGTGVLINVAAGAKMTIEDGTVISGNAVSGAGNTPYALIKVCGELTMNGGEIINNEFAHRALISIEGGKFVMNGGTIANNTFTGTGSTAIFYLLSRSSTFEMNGGTISDNNLGSSSSSAVFNSFSNSNSGALVVNGGTVKNNIAGGADRFAYIDGLDSISIASAADVSGIVYDPWGVGTKDVNDIKQ